MATQPKVGKVANYKRETHSILALIHKLHPIEPKIAQLIFDKNGLQKPTQNLFYNILHYLLFFIDPQVHASLTWPLHDTTAERAFRNELSCFIKVYAAKKLLTEVRASHLVLPTSFKVTVLMYQLSVLALKQLALPRIKGTEKQTLFDEVTDKYNNGCDFKNLIENRQDNISERLSQFMFKKQYYETRANHLHKKIATFENKIININAQGYIDNLINSFVSKHALDEQSLSEILLIKNIDVAPKIFEDSLKFFDEQMDEIEAEWDSKVLPLVNKCGDMFKMSQEMIMRNKGEIPRSSYTLEYNPKTDQICTDELQKQVNPSQKYILRNVIQYNGRLNFPNLIRAFLISICYILKNITFGNDIYAHNQRLEDVLRATSDLRSGLQALLESVYNTEKKLQITPSTYHIKPVSSQIFKIPQLPILTDLKMNKNQTLNCNTFTPVNVPIHRFKRDAFPKEQSRSTLTINRAFKEDFLKCLTTSRGRAYDHYNSSYMSNISIISNIKANETFAEGPSRLTTLQKMRLLSSKKSSMKKQRNEDKHDNNVKLKRDLFNESFASNDGHGLFRSYSSPNLLEDRQSRIPVPIRRGRKLSIMQEDSPTTLEVSGIARLDSNYSTPTGLSDAENSQTTLSCSKTTNDVKTRRDIEKELENSMSPCPDQIIAANIPIITVTPHHGNSMQLDKNNISLIPMEDIQSNNATPKNSVLIKKTNSLEKIISRYKLYRSNSAQDKDQSIITIAEEKEIVQTNDRFSVNKNLLPDLLSPSYSLINRRSSSEVLCPIPVDFDMEDVQRNPRNSLGTLLGVDLSFLDQFDLVD